VRKSNLSIGVVGAFLILWLGWSFWDAYRPKPVVLQGQIEAQEYSMSSKLPGRIGAVLVRKGDTVVAGQLLFTIDSPEIAAKLTQAQGTQKAARAMAHAADSGAREQEVAAARDQWETAKAAEELAQKSFERMDVLFKDGVIAEQRRDEVYAGYQVAQYQAQAAFELYSMAKEGTRSEVKEAAAGQATAASGLVAEVEAAAADTDIRSAYDGEVASVFLHAGEIAPQGFPVVTIVNMAESWAVFQVREDMLQQTQKDTQIEVRIPALGEEMHAFKITHISVMGDFATWRATNATEGYDLKTFEVEARPLIPIADLRVGMTVLLQLN
jgi:HlyD family secretion protein